MSHQPVHPRSFLSQSFELAYAPCRFPSCTTSRRELGCATLTDGTYLWPEGLVHYIKQHHGECYTISACKPCTDQTHHRPPPVRPPAPFLQHVAAQSGVIANRNHLQWDAATQATSPCGQGTLEYLRQRSTLRFSSLPKAAATPRTAVVMTTATLVVVLVVAVLVKLGIMLRG